MYANIDQANDYISNYYSSSDTLRTAWEALFEEDKQVMLNKAAQTIDLLPFTGRPVHKDKVFPRYPNPEKSLELVMIANIELALHNLDEEYKSRYDLQRQGVKSYKLGDLSETFGGGGGPDAYAGVDQYSYSIVFPFLKDYLGGGYDICPTHMRMCHGKHVRH